MIGLRFTLYTVFQTHGGDLKHQTSTKESSLYIPALSDPGTPYNRFQATIHATQCVKHYTSSAQPASTSGLLYVTGAHPVATSTAAQCFKITL